jgi:hypothetical protein
VSLRPVTIEQFPGLDLRQDPGDARAAIDLMNVTLEQGRVRTRPGSTLMASAGARVDYMATFPSAGSPTPNLIAYTASGTGVLTVYGPSGAQVGLTTTTTLYLSRPTSINIGTPSGSFFYFTHAGIAVVKRWDGGLWSDIATFPGSICVFGISPTDNRLAACDAFSKVSFSDPGAPETYGANNFVRLTPGDGEAFMGAATYNNQLFIFKESKFFVFYGNTVDGAGNPVFNYRAVATGIGMQKPFGAATSDPATQCVKATPNGVYFLNRFGIYRTTGGTPVKISAPLDPFFTAAGLSSFSTLGSYSTASPSSSQPSLTAVGGKLYCALPTGASTGLIFVYDEQQDSWTVWNLWPAGATAAFPRTSAPVDALGLAFAPQSGTSILRLDETATADNGAAIVSRYRLPFETYGTPGEKRIRETILEGTGTPTVQWSRDWGGLTTGSAVTLGTSPAVAVGRQRLAIRGRAFSLQLGAASGAWAVNRVQPNLGEGIRGAEATV